MTDNKPILDLDNLPKSEDAFKRLQDTLNSISLPKFPKPINVSKLSFAKDNQLSFDKDTGVLKIKGGFVKFTLNKKMADVLELLFSQSLAKEWTWDEIFEEWGDEVDDFGSPKKASEIIYNTGKNINKRVAAETSNKSFLIVTYKKIKINPKYVN